jgi:RNA polymerase sigma factor (sigma-70 family)
MTPGISDGFGDDLTPAELVAMHEPLAKVIASEWQTPDAPYEDLLQENRIKIWQLAEAKAGNRSDLRGLASVAMRRRSSEIAARQTWTGYESQHGRPTDPLRSPRESMEAIVEAVGTDVFGAVDAMDGVELAYHEGQILRALASLAPRHREYVYLRFWGGWTNPEIAETMGTTKSAVNSWWNAYIRPSLASSLRHLVEAR